MAKATKPTDVPESVAEVQDQIPTIPTDAFKVGDKEYRFLIPQFYIPGVGNYTASDALADDTAQEVLGSKSVKEWLVDVGAQVISEV